MTTQTINYDVKNVFSDSELEEESVIRNSRIPPADGESDFDRLVDETRRLEGTEEPQALGPGKKGRKR
jgi:hypothetical protein